MSWEHKVESVISKLSAVSYRQANYDKQGRKYKKHRPYSIPQEAQILTECLGMRDRVAAEIRAKEIMMLLRNEGVEIDDSRASSLKCR